jgi:hypothetical protein
VGEWCEDLVSVQFYRFLYDVAYAVFLAVVVCLCNFPVGPAAAVHIWGSTRFLSGVLCVCMRAFFGVGGCRFSGSSLVLFWACFITSHSLVLHQHGVSAVSLRALWRLLVVRCVWSPVGGGPGGGD